MSIRIKRIGVAGDWTSLMSRLPGWQSFGLHSWSNGREVLVTHSPDDEFDLTFAASHEARERIGQITSRVTSPSKNRNCLSLTSPAGMRIGIVNEEFAEPEKANAYALNHVAINCPEILSESNWFKEWLGNAVVLQRLEAWDPIGKRLVQDEHLFRDPFFYITMRAWQGRVLDHIGWMAQTPQLVDLAAKHVQESGLEIVFGPTNIDGSYLFHFRGPDDRVHDFFCPGQDIRQRSELTSGHK